MAYLLGDLQHVPDCAESFRTIVRSSGSRLHESYICSEKTVREREVNVRRQNCCKTNLNEYSQTLLHLQHKSIAPSRPWIRLSI